MRSATPYQALALIVAGANLVAAHPKVDGHYHHHRRQDFSNSALYENVNWATVNFGGGSPPAATPPPSNPQQVAPVSSAVVASPTPSPPEQGPAKAAVAQSSSPVSSSPPSTGGNPTGSKRGVAYNESSPSLDAWSSSSAITWSYNWVSNPSPGSVGQYVPMLHSDDPSFTGSWDSDVSAATGGSGTNYLLGFNEPDIVAQANMAVGDAVNAYQKYMTPKASDTVLLGSPAVTNGQGTNSAGIPYGLDWLTQFLGGCGSCQVSFAVVHWYGCENGDCSVQEDINNFESFVKSAVTAAKNADGTQIPVWVTEFQREGDGAEEFMTSALSFLDGENGVDRYAYFMYTEGILASGSGLSSLGQQYAS